MENTATNLRNFEVIDESGNTVDKYTGSTPKQAASKAFTKIVSKSKKDGVDINESSNIYVRESTPGSSGKTYGFTASRIILDNPAVVKINCVRTGETKTITYNYKNDIKKIDGIDGIIPEFNHNTLSDSSESSESENTTSPFIYHYKNNINDTPPIHLKNKIYDKASKSSSSDSESSDTENKQPNLKPIENISENSSSDSESDSDDIKMNNVPTNKKRYFKYIDTDGTAIGRYTGATPKQAACKAFTKLVQRNKLSGIDMATTTIISLKESTRKSARRTFTYSATRRRLDNPQSVEIVDKLTGQTKHITYEYRNDIRKVTTPLTKKPDPTQLSESDSSSEDMQPKKKLISKVSKESSSESSSESESGDTEEKKYSSKTKFSIGFEILYPFGNYYGKIDKELYLPYEFGPDDKFCWLPPDIVNGNYVIDDSNKIDFTDEKYYIKCIPRETSFGDLILIAMGKLRESQYKWILLDMQNNGGHTYLNGNFQKKENNIWYYDCDS